MTNNINEILATKRDWAKAENNRRKRKGTIEDRKNLADCIREGRKQKHKFHCTCSACEVQNMKDKAGDILYILIICAVVGLFFCFLGKIKKMEKAGYKRTAVIGQTAFYRKDKKQ
jgi:hypothetical protein